MLHEILLALLGYTGDLIIDVREQRRSLGILSADAPFSDEGTFKLAPDFLFVDPSDRDAIERIIMLGFYYRELDRFALKSRNLSWIRSPLSESPLLGCGEISKRSAENQSVYRRAIANGIVEILSVYRSVVLQIEQKMLADPLPILATVTQGLNKFYVILPPLHELIFEIERDDVRGGKLLSLLHRRCHCKVPELQTCIQRLLWHGHQVMYSQFASWVVYGILQDSHGEFFIRRQENRDEQQDSSNPEMLGKLTRLSMDDSSLTDWHLGFRIALDMLPEYIPTRVAESIHFAGKAIRVLRNPSPGFQLQNHQKFPRQSQRIHCFNNRVCHKMDMSEYFDSIGDELLPQSEADKIEVLLQDLKEATEFHSRSFERAIDSIRSVAASHLWQLVVVRADLNGHLKSLKDYFLLAKGDFFQLFEGIPFESNTESRSESKSFLKKTLLFLSNKDLLRYLSALISQSFLDFAPVRKILDTIMNICLQFCRKIQNEENPSFSELNNISQIFKERSNALYTILRINALVGSQRAPFLRRFLLCLNFNSFFEETAKLQAVQSRPSLPVIQQ